MHHFQHIYQGVGIITHAPEDCHGRLIGLNFEGPGITAVDQRLANVCDRIPKGLRQRGQFLTAKRFGAP